MITGLVAAFIFGLILATANYLLLWLTVKRLVGSRAPASLAFASFILRTTLAVLGFYMATKGDPLKLIACVLGFLLVRAVALRRAAPAGAVGGGGRG